MTESFYVYGVIPAADADEWPGVPGIDGPVRAITEGDLAALVSPLSPDHVPGTRDDIEQHRRVLSQASANATAVPMRFGIVMDDEETVRRQLLSEHADELSGLLNKLADHVQMTVRAYYAEDALLASVFSSDTEIARQAATIGRRSELETRQERIDLGERVSDAITERRAEDEQALLERLAPLADDVRVDDPSGERLALSAHLLVRRERRPELDATVRALGRILQGVMAISYIGPLPAYSFADIALDGDA
jgi:hypothetical protein